MRLLELGAASHLLALTTECHQASGHLQLITRWLRASEARLSLTQGPSHLPLPSAPGSVPLLSRRLCWKEPPRAPHFRNGYSWSRRRDETSLAISFLEAHVPLCSRWFGGRKRDLSCLRCLPLSKAAGHREDKFAGSGQLSPPLCRAVSSQGVCTHSRGDVGLDYIGTILKAGNTNNVPDPSVPSLNMS